MTNEKAIYLLGWLKCKTGREDDLEAIDKAIAALKRPTDGDLISRQDAIDAVTKHFRAHDNDLLEVIAYEIEQLPSAEPKQDEESILKFYHVESIDDYWIGQRLDNFYYADWHEGLGFVWSKSRYLPWGEHVVAPDTLWKEHTYPSEPKEIPFTEWIVGFMKKYAQPKRGEWIGDKCSVCGEERAWYGCNPPFCPNCGAKMEADHELV